MNRLKTIFLAFLIIIQALEEDHILVYAHQGGEAGHKSLHYRWSLQVSKHLMVERKLGLYKRSKSSSLKLKHMKNKSSGRYFASYDDYRGPARHPPRHNL
ncbi:unnamed protein product [Cochlearia groenlandica]